MSSTRKSKEPADDLRSITLEFHPYTAHTVAALSVSRRDAAGPHRFVLARWHLSTSRADLAGHTTDDVVLSLLDMVQRRVSSGLADPADTVAGQAPTGVAPGAPVGATGATVGQDLLPGM